jgi:formate hydrogenlyase transcriptional activator
MNVATVGRMMTGIAEPLAPPVNACFETLVRVTRLIGAHRDPSELFRVLADELLKVVQFDFVSVLLRDEHSGAFRNWFLDVANPSTVIPVEDPTPEETFPSWAYEGQEPLLTSTDELEPRYLRLQTKLKDRDIRSICALPLTTAHHKLGAITLYSKHADPYAQNKVRLLCQVADQIALAFDDALNLAALQRASEELERKNERLQLLLDLTNQVVSNLELRDLLRAISQDLRRAMQSDYAGLSLPEPGNKELRLYALDFPEGKGFLGEDLVYPVEGAPSGTAFRTMKPMALQSPFTEWINYPIVRMAEREGLQSFCFLPLIARNRAIGVLVLARLTNDAFSEGDVLFLTQVSNQVAIAVENALAYREIRELKEQLSKEKLYLEDEIRTEMKFGQIIGSSGALRKVLKQVETVAPTDSTVLIYGETGTGKELIARAIHDLSPRRSKPFVKLNCAAIPTGLLESELFGHEKGAFTGAIAQRIGRFEIADSGTIFLDEIGEIPLELQTKLLRVLQEREFERLGSSKTLRTNARLIAATNRDLEAMVGEQKFRSDLFFRLNVFPVHVPALRDRPADIPLLVRHFAEQFSRRMNKVIDTIPSATMEALCRYHWPGNIRELQNVIERAVIITTGPTLNVDLADLRVSGGSRPQQAPDMANSESNGSLDYVLEQAERQQILAALEQSNWVVAGPKGAAARLCVKRSTLQQRIRRLGIAR